MKSSLSLPTPCVSEGLGKVLERTACAFNWETGVEDGIKKQEQFEECPKEKKRQMITKIIAHLLLGYYLHIC